MSDFKFKDAREATDLLLSDDGARALAVHYAHDNGLGTEECLAMEEAVKNQQLGVVAMVFGCAALSLLEMARFGIFLRRKFKKR